jgi:hypothetical protein
LAHGSHVPLTVLRSCSKVLTHHLVGAHRERWWYGDPEELSPHRVNTHLGALPKLAVGARGMVVVAGVRKPSHYLHISSPPALADLQRMKRCSLSHRYRAVGGA